MSGPELRDLLHRNVVGHARFARLMGAHPSTVHRWLVGDHPVPPEVALLATILDRTDLTISDLEQMAA